MTLYLLYRRLGGPQGRSGRVRKVLPPLGFDPRTVQPVTSRCTNYAALAHTAFVRGVTEQDVAETCARPYPKRLREIFVIRSPHTLYCMA